MADERWQHPLYTTEAINDEGLEGHAYVPGGLKVQTSSPLNIPAPTQNNFWACR